MSASCAYDTVDGRWHRRRCSERTGGMSPVDGVARTQAAEGGEPNRGEGGVAGGWQLLGVLSMRLAPGGVEN